MDDPVRLVWVVSALLMGLCVGSFVNVLIFRLPRGRSVVQPRSHCFCCGTELGLRDLMPIFSYLLQRRCCRYCGAALSSQYAWVEGTCGLLFAVMAWLWGMSFTTVVYMAATAALLASFVTDLKHKIIPTELNTAVFVLGLGGSVVVWVVRPLLDRDAAWWLGPAWLPTPAQSLAGAVVGYVVFEAIVRIGRRLFGQEAMGGGDVLLSAAVGTFLGPWRRFGAYFLIGIIGGAMVGVLLMAIGRLSRREPIPFGPFLIIAALTVWLCPQVADWVAGKYGFQ